MDDQELFYIYNGVFLYHGCVESFQVLSTDDDTNPKYRIRLVCKSGADYVFSDLSEDTYKEIIQTIQLVNKEKKSKYGSIPQATV